MLDLRQSLQQARSVLLIGAHCDDIEIGAGGTIAEFLASNSSIEAHWFVLTGTDERRGEARAAAELFGGGALASFQGLDFRDRYLQFDPAVKEAFDELGRSLEPDLVISPWDGDAHQDHRTAGQLTKNTFRDHLILQYEIPKYDGDLGRPNVYVPVSTERAQAKVDGLLASFPSQKARDWFTPETFTALMRLRGIECRSDSGFAEAFHTSKVVL